MIETLVFQGSNTSATVLDCYGEVSFQKPENINLSVTPKNWVFRHCSPKLWGNCIK